MAKAVGSGRSIVQLRQTRRAAAIDRWYLWIVAVVGTVLAWYFYTNPDIWALQAEGFYVLIFGGAAFLAVVAGAYRIYSRPTYSTPR
jgi:hypothetical protein